MQDASRWAATSRRSFVQSLGVAGIALAGGGNVLAATVSGVQPALLVDARFQDHPD